MEMKQNEMKSICVPPCQQNPKQQKEKKGQLKSSAVWDSGLFARILLPGSVAVASAEKGCSLLIDFA